MNTMPTWPVMAATACYVVAVGSWCAMVWHLSRLVWQLHFGMSARGAVLQWNISAVFRTASFSPTGRTCWEGAKRAFAVWVMAIAGSALVAMLGSAP